MVSELTSQVRRGTGSDSPCRQGALPWPSGSCANPLRTYTWAARTAASWGAHWSGARFACALSTPIRSTHVGVRGLEAVLRMLWAWRLPPFLPRDQRRCGRQASRCFSGVCTFRLSLVSPANHKATLRTKGTLSGRYPLPFHWRQGGVPVKLVDSGETRVQSATASGPFSAGSVPALLLERALELSFRKPHPLHPGSPCDWLCQLPVWPVSQICSEPSTHFGHHRWFRGSHVPQAMCPKPGP